MLVHQAVSQSHDAEHPLSGFWLTQNGETLLTGIWILGEKFRSLAVFLLQVMPICHHFSASLGPATKMLPCPLHFLYFLHYTVPRNVFTCPFFFSGYQKQNNQLSLSILVCQRRFSVTECVQPIPHYKTKRSGQGGPRMNCEGYYTRISDTGQRPNGMWAGERRW